jgi:VWFA-related protein
MRLGKFEFGAGVLMATGVMVGCVAVGCVALAQPYNAPAGQQDTTQKHTAPAAQVPDAPRPQTLPTLNTITPTAPAIPNAPAPTAAATAADDNAGATAPQSGLPGAPAPTAQQDAGQTPELPAPGQGPGVFRLRRVVNFVEIPFTVKDSKGVLVPGLTWRDVRVYENGVRQQMAVFTTDPFPLSVAVVLVQSVDFKTMEKVNDSLAALQGAFSPYDEVSVFTYNNGVRKQTDFTAAQSARLGVILDRSKGKGEDPVMGLGGPISQTLIKNNQIVDPNTTAVRGQQGIQLNAPKEYHTLNDAILAAAEDTATAAKGRRRVVYVISDGKESGSTAKEKDVIKYLQTNRISVYATLVGDASIPGVGFLDRIHLPLTMRDDVLPRYAAATGGQCDPEFRPRGIENSFARITETVRTQYTVGFYSHEPILDGKFRRVEVRVLRPNLTIVAKEGYYPSAQDSGPIDMPAASTPMATP